MLKLVKTYRVTRGWPDRQGLAERILAMIEGDLTFFVAKAVHSSVAKDVTQETLKAIFMGLAGFNGKSNGAFWAWCYQIARNKINDQIGAQYSNRLLPMPEEDLWQLVETSVQPSRLSPSERHDLREAMRLLAQSKPECQDYLWQHFVFGLDYSEIATAQNLTYDNVRMRIGRCLEEAQSLVS